MRNLVNVCDMFFHYTALSLNINEVNCPRCRNVTTGAGMEYGFAVRRYLDLVVDTSLQPGASPGSSLNVGGTLWTATRWSAVGLLRGALRAEGYARSGVCELLEDTGFSE